MKEINDEINLTINLMQGDIDDGAHEVLYSHLCQLFEMKRERFTERSWVVKVAGFSDNAYNSSCCKVVVT